MDFKKEEEEIKPLFQPYTYIYSWEEEKTHNLLRLANKEIN